MGRLARRAARTHPDKTADRDLLVSELDESRPHTTHATRTMLRVVLLSVILAAASAQHHVDPFAGSGCDCATFCSGKCAINATVSRLSCTRASCPYTTAKGSAQGQRYASSSWCSTCAVFVSPRLSGGGPVFADGSGLCRSTAPSCAFATIQLERAGTLHAGTRAGSDNSFTHSPLHYSPPSIAFSLSFSSSPTHSFQPAANMTLYR